MPFFGTITERDFRKKIQSTETYTKSCNASLRIFFPENTVGDGPVFWIFFSDSRIRVKSKSAYWQDLNISSRNLRKFLRFRGPLTGQIFVTNYRFIFKADVSNTIFLQVPLNSLSKGIIQNISSFYNSKYPRKNFISKKNNIGGSKLDCKHWFWFEIQTLNHIRV